MKTIEKGDAPTSLINTGLSGLLRREVGRRDVLDI